jgi:hypothetical protein
VASSAGEESSRNYQYLFLFFFNFFLLKSAFIAEVMPEKKMLFLFLKRRNLGDFKY